MSRSYILLGTKNLFLAEHKLEKWNDAIRSNSFQN